MIKVTYYRKRYNKVTIEGHAKSGEAGHDLVCASASILAYTLAANVQAMKAAGHVKNMDIKLEPGDTEIRCAPKAHFQSAVKLIFDAICAGYELLSKQYPANISYEIRE